MQKPFFSVSIPAYNLEKYIAATIQSVLAQIFQDFEIIIVDDGSTDGTVSIIQSFHDQRIHLISQRNGGVSRARNAGMKKAQGLYIAFLDGDDYWYPEHLALAANFFNLHPEILVYSNRHILDELANIAPRPPSHPVFIRKLGLRGLLFMHPSNVILSSSLAFQLPSWEENMSYGEDGLYWTRCMRQTALIGLGGTVTSIYRQRASSAMHDVNYRHVSIHTLLAPLLDELEAMKKPTWQFAVHFLIIRELHSNRLLALDEEERTSLLGRIRKVTHPYLNRTYFDAYAKACFAKEGMEQSFTALMNRTVSLCVWLDRLERMGRSMLFLNRNQ